MTTINLKYGKYNVNAMNIETIKANNGLASLFSTIDSSTNDTEEYVKLKFTALDVPAYLILIKDTKEARGIHYCEANEKGVNCSHAAALAAVADILGFKLTTINIKSSVSDILNFKIGFDEKSAKNLNNNFGLLPIVDDADEDDAVVTTVAAPTNHAPVAQVSSVTGPRDPKKNWKKIQDYLQAENVKVALIHRIYELRESISKLPVLDFQAPAVEPNMPYIGIYLERAIMHILRGKHLLLIGDMGSGKDTLINTISWVFNYPKVIVTASSSDTKESLVAEPAFKNNQSTYDYSELSKSVQNGGLVNFAEANMLMGDTTSALHSLFDENESLPTPVGTIERHEHFLLMGSLNIGSNYSGTKKLNPAFKDRFAVLRLPQGQLFKDMISRKTGLMDQSALKFLEDIKNAVEEFNQEGRGLDAKTYRGYEDAARFFIDFGFNVDNKTIVVEDYILNKEEDYEEHFELREAIRLAHPSLPVSDEEQAYLDSHKK